MLKLNKERNGVEPVTIEDINALTREDLFAAGGFEYTSISSDGEGAVTANQELGLAAELRLCELLPDVVKLEADARKEHVAGNLSECERLLSVVNELPPRPFMFAFMLTFKMPTQPHEVPPAADMEFAKFAHKHMVKRFLDINSAPESILITGVRAPNKKQPKKEKQ